MRKITLSCILVLMIIPAVSFAQYSSPESVAYDTAGKRYFISNTSSSKIVQKSQTGTVTDFVTVGGSIHGVTVSGGRVYVCNGTRVRGYDLISGSEVMNVQIPSATFLNDISSDNNGFLYISNFSNTAGQRTIYKISPAASSYWAFAQMPRQPNGVYVDQVRNRLLVASWGSGATVSSVSLSDSTSITTLITTPYSNFDGISLDRNDNVYLSSYSGGTVLRYDINFTLPAFTVASGQSSPADIYVNRLTDTLAVPNAGNNTVNFITLTIPLSANGNTIKVEDFRLYQNYPNPFNPVTTIEFLIPYSSFVEIRVYDNNGKEVENPVRSRLGAGNYKISFNGSSFSTGTYYYEMKINGESAATRKMILLK